MSELATGFQTLPIEYQSIIQLAQDQHEIAILPLQQLAGGWSGAILYLVSVSWQGSSRLEHLVLKLDRKSGKSKSDEITRHQAALSKSPPDFARQHLAQMAFERVEHENAVAIFYAIAGQSLRDYLPLSAYQRQSQLETIFAATNHYLLAEWNAGARFEPALHPRLLLEKWLGFRLEAGGNIESFLQKTCHIPPDTPGLLINAEVYPNPLAYARLPEYWGSPRPIDVLAGFIHGDLNTNNILAKFSPNAAELEGYYLIDFALLKEHLPLLYDQRYLEMSYLMLSLGRVPLARWVELVERLAQVDVLAPEQAPIELAGVCAVIGSGRRAFQAWVQENHPSLHDDLWGQYWLAGVAAGLGYCHKTSLPEEERLAGLIFAAANLKRYASLYKIPPPGEVRLLYEASRAPKTTSPPPASPPLARAPQHNLPAQPTRFIGRQKELADVRAMLLRQEVRLVSLTGPGGTGKTRLSLEIASALLEHFPEGVYFIPLAEIADPQLVVSKIAQQLEVQEAGSQPLLENLKDYLRDRSFLLVLDNFEQVVSAAPLLTDLLGASPGLKALITSRVVLNLRGEHEYAVPPLLLPETVEGASIERLAEYESIQLFVERSRAADPAFALSDENAGSVSEICRRLDGLPLAIELAAARIKLLTPREMLARLSDRLRLLTGGARDLPARQRTLRNTLDWSYSLLNPDEQRLYARLGVFVGGFTLEAAEAVCNPDNRLDVMEGVLSLVNNSLLQQSKSEQGQSRYRMLETIRAYALEKLEEHADLAEMRRQHAQFYAAMVIQETDKKLFSPEATFWLNWIESQYDNIHAALVWSQESPQSFALGLQLAADLIWFWYRRGYFNEGRTWTEHMLSSPLVRDYSLERAIALINNAQMAMWQSDLDVAEARSKEGLSIVQALENEELMPVAMIITGVALINMGKDRQAHSILQEAQALFKEFDLPYQYAIVLVHLGNVALGLGDPDEAQGWLEQALEVMRKHGDEWGLSFALNNLGEVARVRGDYPLARAYYVESEALLRSTRDHGDLARLVHSLGYVAQQEGDYEQAEARFQESLAMFRRLGNKRGIAECLAGLAGLAARQGRVQWGAALLAAAQALLSASRASWWPADRVEIEHNRSMMQAALDGQDFQAAWSSGQAMTLDQAIAYASNGN